MRTLIATIALVCAYASGENLMTNAAGSVSLTALDWTDLGTTSGVTPDYMTSYDDAFYVPTLRAYCTDASYREPSSEPNRSWACYSLRENRWFIMDFASTVINEHLPEGGHSMGQLKVDPTTGVSLGQCCHSGSQVSEGRRLGMYLYDFFAQVGIPKFPAHGLKYDNQLGSSAFDVYNNKLISFGGASFQGVMVYDPTTNDWTTTPVSTSCVGACPDPSISQHALTYDYADGQIYLFGGLVATTLQTGLFKYNHATTTWTQITPTCSPSCPSARMNSGFVYDPDDNVFLLYGGCITQPATNCTLANDTYIFDPVANTWTPITTAHSPNQGAAAIFEKIVYLWEDHVFVGYFNPTGSTFKTWAFAYRPAANAGTVSRTYGYTAGTLNRNAPGAGATDQTNSSLAYGGALASSGTTLYQIWSETALNNIADNGRFVHPYVRSFTGTTPANLGTGFSAVDGNTGGDLEVFDPSVAVVGGTPWACWHDQGTSTTQRVKCKGYSAGAWSLGGTITPVDTSLGFDSKPKIVDVGGVPTIALAEQDRGDGNVVHSVYGYVFQYSGGVFTQLGAALNSGTDTIHSLSIASDGAAPWVAYAKYVISYSSEGTNFTAPQVYVAKWTGASWQVQCSGTSANISSTLGFASNVSLTVMGGVPYVAFTERLAAGGVNKLYVRSCSGAAGTWSTTGTGYRNVDQNIGQVFWNDIQNDGTNLYLTWNEQGIDQTWVNQLSFQTSRAVRPKVYVAKYNGSAWSKLGGTLNMDTQNGSATHPSLAIFNSQPTVQFGEVNLGAHRQMYAKSWNGTDWVALGAGGGGGGTSATALSGTWKGTIH